MTNNAHHFELKSRITQHSSEYSFPYVAGWEGKEQNLLKASLATIRETAESLITDIDAKFQELAKGLEQAAPEVEPGTYSRSFTTTGLNRWNV